MSLTQCPYATIVKLTRENRGVVSAESGTAQLVVSERL